MRKGIENSLGDGEKKYLSPMKVKNFEVYAKPLSEQSVRATMAWNAAYPTAQLNPPEKIDVVKVKMEKLEDLEPLKISNPEIYENLKKGIFENRNPDVVAKGITVFGLPQNLPSVPDWLIPFIDIQTIRNDNVNRFIPVIASLGISTITMDTKTFYSNIKKLG